MTPADGSAGPPVLVVDDEPQIVRALAAVLRGAGFSVLTATTGEEALRMAALRTPSAILLDLGLPDVDGTEVCRRIREWSEAPVIVVSAADHEHGKIDALDAGADDYVTKPFSAPELLARLRAVIRRAAVPADAEAVLCFGGSEIDLGRRVVRRNGEPVHLTAREYALLARLAAHPGRVLTHATLLRDVWGPAYVSETHYLRVHMANLRKKLELDAAAPRHLLTESGVGYRLEPGA